MKVTRGLIFIMSGVMIDAVLNGHVIFALVFFGLPFALWFTGEGNQK